MRTIRNRPSDHGPYRPSLSVTPCGSLNPPRDSPLMIGTVAALVVIFVSIPAAWVCVYH